MNRALVLLGILAALPCAYSQATATVSARESFTAQVEAGSLTVAPAIGTDLLLRAAGAAELPAPIRARLARDAFDLAVQIQSPYPLTRIFSGPTDSLPSQRARGDALGLDRLSAQLKSLNILLSLDRPAALDRLSTLGYPKLQPVGCQESFAYDFTLWYGTLGKAASGYTRNDDRLAFLEPYFQSISSPAQVGPAARLAARQPAPLLSGLAGWLAAAIGRMAPDPRQTAWSARDAVAGVVGLGEICQRCGREVLEAYRDYLNSALRSGLCADRWSAASEFETLTKVNKVFSSHGLDLLDFNSSAIRTTEVSDNPDQIWADPLARPLLDAWRQIRRQPGSLAASLDAQAVVAYDERAAQWAEPGAAENKVLLVRALSLLAPLNATQGELRRECLRNYIEMLDGSPVRHDDPTLWLSFLYEVPGANGGAGAVDLVAALAGANSQELGLYRLVLDRNAGR